MGQGESCARLDACGATEPIDIVQASRGAAYPSADELESARSVAPLSLQAHDRPLSRSGFRGHHLRVSQRNSVEESCFCRFSRSGTCCCRPQEKGDEFLHGRCENSEFENSLPAPELALDVEKVERLSVRVSTWSGGTFPGSTSSATTIATQQWSDSDMELEEETSKCPVEFLSKRRGAVCAPGQRLYCKETPWPKQVKDIMTEARLQEALEQSYVFRGLGSAELRSVVDAFTVDYIEGDRDIIKQGDMGDELFVVLSGCLACYRENDISSLRGLCNNLDACTRPLAAPDRRKFVCSRKVGAIVGELSIIWSAPRALSVVTRGDCVLGRLKAEVYHSIVVQGQRKLRELREECLRSVPLLEMLDDEAIMQLADVMKVSSHMPGEAIIQQGDIGDELFVVQSGECVATVRTFDDIQEVRRFGTGDLFGELALLRNSTRAATVTAVSDVVVMRLGRRSFERMLGSLALLRERQYLRDPRKLIADFYQQGDARGPRGSLQRLGVSGSATERSQASSWFAVFRPTSRDAIAKMLGGMAVGKGLNIKGKSAKKSILSGYVPFVQISDNAHKALVDKPPEGAVVQIFFRAKDSRDQAKELLASGCSGARLCQILDKYEPEVFGLEVPASYVYETYIRLPDLTPRIGWETGRPSEPAYMNMNMEAACSNSEPKVVLLQNDNLDPGNPQGLLVAYAEEHVKPVVSDFDAMLVASTNVKYEPLPVDQQHLMLLSLQCAEEILSRPSDETWTSRWLQWLKKMSTKGHHPKIPAYGFGDPTSYRLMGDVIAQTAPCGAVRHGAECFNFYFPQEIDDEYLVVWEGFPEKPWDYMSDENLRKFLIDRVTEGFSFPINPVWAVRDRGWYEVLHHLRISECAQGNLEAWFPKEAGILDRIDSIHSTYPLCFCTDNGTGGQRPVGGPCIGRTASISDVAVCYEKMSLAIRSLRRASRSTNFSSGSSRTEKSSSSPRSSKEESPSTRRGSSLRSIFPFKDKKLSLRSASVNAAG